jgi:flagellar motility protein MotE (MotC chaperone)
MAAQAQISSIEALEDFRSDLIVFIGQMQPVIDETSSEVLRMRQWLENEQRPLWQEQLRRRRLKLDEAQAELFNARISLMNDSCVLPQMAVQKAKRSVTEAEQKIAAIKKWLKELEPLTEPLLKQIEQLRGYLSADLGRAVVNLAENVKLLDAYAKIASPGKL